jgi:hypothetical protein
MGRTVMTLDALYVHLEQTARARGFSSIAQWLEVWQSHEDMLRQCQKAYKCLHLTLSL